MIFKNKRTNYIKSNKWIIISILGLIAFLFIVLFQLKLKIHQSDNSLPITSRINNTLKTSIDIKIDLNDSIYKMHLDSMNSTEYISKFRLGLNKLKITLNDTMQYINDTLHINKRTPGLLLIEIDNPKDKIRDFWKLDSLSLRNYYFYKSIIKSDSFRRVKFIIFRRYID
jgi:hypothetical protein